MNDTNPIIDEILDALAGDPSMVTKDDFHKLKNTIFGKYALAKWFRWVDFIARYDERVRQGDIKDEIRIRKILRKRAIRSLSGVSVISLLTKFWGCPGKCVFCPTYDDLPKSYITNEPAVQRAQMNEFDPVRQIQNRLRSLEITGNAISKCDVRVIGGTWSVYPSEYREDFIKNIYDAHTTYAHLRGFIEWVESGNDPFAKFKIKNGYQMQASANLEEAKSRNESAESRVIGIAIETRPDWINEEEIKCLRRYGVTRVEIGYQTTIDEINEINKRGHGNRESIHATRLLKDAGFKVVAHMMPGLLSATPETDRASMREVFENSDFRPDEMKIYPMVVTPHSELEKVWRDGGFEPYDDETLIWLMSDLQGILPEYLRLNRMYRDIPASEILAGSKLANLRQVTDAYMQGHGIVRRDISAREIRAKGNNIENAILEEYFYEASGGHEYFIQMIDPADRTIFGLLRLRVPSQHFTGETHFLEILDGAAIIRELHVFGDQLGIGQAADGKWQHSGFGKRMMARAESIIKIHYPKIKKIAVIAGVGVRAYYAKLWYQKQDEYMIKNTGEYILVENTKHAFVPSK